MVGTALPCSADGTRSICSATPKLGADAFARAHFAQLADEGTSWRAASRSEEASLTGPFALHDSFGCLGRAGGWRDRVMQLRRQKYAGPNAQPHIRLTRSISMAWSSLAGVLQQSTARAGAMLSQWKLRADSNGFRARENTLPADKLEART